MLKKRWVGIEEILCVFLLLVITLSTGLQIINRFLIGASLPWTEELARYAFIWLSLFGVSLGVKHRKHLSVDLIKSYLSKRMTKILEVFVYLLFLLFCAIGVVYGIEVCSKAFGHGQLSPALQMKMGYVYLAIPVGLGFTALRILQQIAKLLMKKEIEQ